MRSPNATEIVMYDSFHMGTPSMPHLRKIVPSWGQSGCVHNPNFFMMLNIFITFISKSKCTIGYSPGTELGMFSSQVFLTVGEVKKCFQEDP